MLLGLEVPGEGKTSIRIKSKQRATINADTKKGRPVRGGLLDG